MVIWLVGLSGSGKTTIGKEIYKMWKPISPNTVMVDGDEVRRIFQQDNDPSDFTLDARRKNALRISEICAWLDRQSINVICCILCLFDDVMLQNRDKFSNYFQVFLDTPMAVLKERDPKGIYKSAELGEIKNVAGLDIKFHPPSFSEMTLSTGLDAPEPESLARQILNTSGVKL